MRIKSKLSVILKIFITLSALGGVTLSLIEYKQDGYSNWYRRLLYFTAQSNIWIGTTCLFLSIATLYHFNEKWVKLLYILKYIFTVSITITGLVFCTLLAPFAPKNYHLWVLSGYLTHIVTPILAIWDFFIDDYPLLIKRRHVVYSVIPPLGYFAITMIFSLFKVDFGRGEFYPYYFLNFRSPAGLFGFSSQAPFFIGSFYWTVLFSILIIFIAWVLKKIKCFISQKYPH